MSKDEILKEMELFSLGGDGIGGWIKPDADDLIFARLTALGAEPLTKVQLDQLLALGHEAPVSDVFFRYYWLEANASHPYDVTKIPDFNADYSNSKAITSLEHLKWGLYRLFVDALLYFGNARTGYRKLRSMTRAELDAFFARKRFDTELIKSRGPALPLVAIAKDDRYLISEMACKSYGEEKGAPGDLKNALVDAFKRHQANSGGAVTIRQLLSGKEIENKYAGRQSEFIFSAVDVLDDSVTQEAELLEKYERLAGRFAKARVAALRNTEFYLSMVNDLDVYVATSMRGRDDFRKMATDCETIFSDGRLTDLQLRYFDPTLSAATSHEDKGLIECLMVKCAKALVYCAGEKESYGKDAEAAMALSLGKPVIFYCDEEQRRRFYRDVHPLSRLIEFETGVAVGAMVTDSLEPVCELLARIFGNRMEYKLEQPRPGYLRLKESLTGSVIRLQTSDRLLAETFWNHYHARDPVSGFRD